MTTIRSALAALAATMLLAETATAQTSESNATSYLCEQCNEDVIKLYVEPSPLQKLVPPGHTVLLFDGRAQVLVIAQDCPQYWLNGEEIGATQEVRQCVP